MPAILQAPGVYIDEDASLAFSVNNSPTAVPVFIGEFTPLLANSVPACTRINNWLEFTSSFSLAPATQVVIRSTKLMNFPLLRIKERSSLNRKLKRRTKLLLPRLRRGATVLNASNYLLLLKRYSSISKMAVGLVISILSTMLATEIRWRLFPILLSKKGTLH
ncbi:hypothetical protein [Yersinia ruckeri]